MTSIQLYLNISAAINNILFWYFQIMTEKQKKEDLIEDKER